MKIYKIWSEGFAATGECGRATRHGTMQGENFKDACINFANTNSDFAKYFDADRMTYWGCRLFDNEGDARVTFG